VLEIQLPEDRIGVTFVVEKSPAVRRKVLGALIAEIVLLRLQVAQSWPPES
jgi:hypothetical protein